MSNNNSYVLFFTDNSFFSHKKGSMTFIPREAVDGYVFAIDKKDLLDKLGVSYEVKPISDVQFPEIDFPIIED